MFPLLSLLLALAMASVHCQPFQGTANPDDPFWLESIKHQGTSAFVTNPSSYQVFRNVKDFGAKGDGVTDDTVAINNAISTGNRCGGGANFCNSSTVTPALVYFPQGSYVVSTPIIAYYYTQIIGDAKVPPTIIAAPGFNGLAVIDADPYIPNGGGAQWYVNQNNFFRSVRNFVIDLTKMPASAAATGLHWQVSQATSLINVVVEMSTAPGNNHQGLFMENGSGGYMGDIVFNGGKSGISVGNQQFTVRNITINNAVTGITGVWNWGWTFQGVTINNCTVGFDLTTGGVDASHQTVGAEAIIDAVVTDTSIFVRSSTASNGKLAGSLVLNNIVLRNVPTAVGVVGSQVVLAGGSKTITFWVQGNVYTGANPTGTFTQNNIPAVQKPSVLLDSAGRIFGKAHPQYESFAVSQFASVKSNGAKGDGITDDTDALRKILAENAGYKIVFFDAGTYVVTDTITVPPNTRIVGEVWSVIAGKGDNFQDQNNPRAVFQVGNPGEEGVAEITDIIFSTIGPTPGAIIVEWNINGNQGDVGMWDTHIRIGGATGTDLDFSNCPAGSTNAACQAAFMSLHLTPASSAYMEGTWVWLADHDLDGDGSSQISLFSGRGILSESAGPVWLIGTAEHHTLFQYNIVNAKNHYMGLIQTETPYYQPVPAPPAPFTSNPIFHDPTFSPDITSAWGLRVQASSNILVFGAGLYSFFQNYNQTCLSNSTCQTHMVDVDSLSSVYIFSLSTIGSTFQLSINEKGIIQQIDNPNGFASTVTLWSPAGYLSDRSLMPEDLHACN